jgi:Fe-S oxidoreductase
MERLKEARDTGARLLVTTCVKCQIHLKCAQGGPTTSDRVDIQVKDLTTLLAERVKPMSKAENGKTVPDQTITGMQKDP